MVSGSGCRLLRETTREVWNRLTLPEGRGVGRLKCALAASVRRVKPVVESHVPASPLLAEGGVRGGGRLVRGRGEGIRRRRSEVSLIPD